MGMCVTVLICIQYMNLEHRVSKVNLEYKLNICVCMQGISNIDQHFKHMPNV